MEAHPRPTGSDNANGSGAGASPSSYSGSSFGMPHGSPLGGSQGPSSGGSQGPSTGGPSIGEAGIGRTFSVSSTSSSPRDPFQSLPSPGTPSPLSPQPVPSPQSPLSSPDTVHDLPGELLRSGWRKFFSKRENRHYFFNKYNNESRWETPPLPSATARSAASSVMPSPASLDMSPDPLRDPLGISSPTPSSGSSDSIPHVGDKRKNSDSLDLGSSSSSSSTTHKPPTIKRTYKGPVFYTVEIHSNVIMFERALVTHLLPPHPDIERERYSMMQKLRQSYRELCHARENIEPPRESFTRWLLERSVTDKGGDPLFPAECPTEISPSMIKEIMGCIPVKLGRARNRNDARQFLSQYADAAKKMADARDIPKESRKLIKWHVDDVMNWLRNQQAANYEDYINRLTHLTRECQPHIQKAAKSSVEGICSKVYHHSIEYAKRIKDKHVALLRDLNVKAESAPDPESCPHQRRVMCYPLQLATPTPRLPVPELFQEGSKTCLRYKGETMSVSTHYFHKLEDLYRVNCKDDPRFDFYLARVYCLLKRYQTFFGSDGASQQVALPVSVFETLHDCFGVTFELFASPLNSFFKQFCSKFGDTDSYFGSRGNLFDFHPLSGSFEANPPFSEELMCAMVDHFENVLSESVDPLSFIIFIPEWRDPSPEALTRLENSRFKQKQILIPKNEHEYRHGFQHVVPEDDLHQKCYAHGTLVFWLQNDAGAAKWGPEPERVKKLVTAFRPKPRERHNSNIDGATASSGSTTSTASSGSSVGDTSVKADSHNSHEAKQGSQSPRSSRDFGHRSHSYSSPPGTERHGGVSRRHPSESSTVGRSETKQHPTPPQNKLSKYSS